jgi:fructose-1,6-bisphosphatase/inositol monophosphatase family enzyme
MNRAEFIKDITRKAGALIKHADPTVGVKIKDGKNDLVTAADKASEKLIVSAIQKEFPDDLIMSEETPFEQKDILNIPHLWVIDPID